MKNICSLVADICNEFELSDANIKKEYILKNINTIKFIMEGAPGFRGCFGTGYPFYVLDYNLDGELPVIDEQLRYNNELLINANDISCWQCESCLEKNAKKMPDLKQICKPCPKICDLLKPRKVINRMCDVDMWMVCNDDLIESAKSYLLSSFDSYNMKPSDVDPVMCIEDYIKIVNAIKAKRMPELFLPLDIHIIEYSKFLELIKSVSIELLSSYNSNNIPYLPIHPISLRKIWQYDDVAYNFILDYLFSLFPFDFDDELKNEYNLSKLAVCDSFNDEDLHNFLCKVSPPHVKRRYETEQLQYCYKRRIESWRR